MEKDIFTLKDLISNLEIAQGSQLVDSNKFGVLRESMRVEKRVKINMAFDHACLTNQIFSSPSVVTAAILLLTIFEGMLFQTFNIESNVSSKD